MLVSVNPKLPMRDKAQTKDFYINGLGFIEAGDYDDYLIIVRDQVQIHFFEFKDLNPFENYGQIYIRTDDIDSLYQSLLNKKISIHPNGHLQDKPWGQREFSIIDMDHNLITFGQSI